MFFVCLLVAWIECIANETVVKKMYIFFICSHFNKHSLRPLAQHIFLKFSERRSDFKVSATKTKQKRYLFNS